MPKQTDKAERIDPSRCPAFGDIDKLDPTCIDCKKSHKAYYKACREKSKKLKAQRVRDRRRRRLEKIYGRNFDLKDIRKHRRVAAEGEPDILKKNEAPTGDKLSQFEAAVAILACCEGRGMSAEELTALMIAEKLWQPPNGGKTPSGTLRSWISRDIAKKGEKSVFRRDDNDFGVFYLREGWEELLDGVRKAK